ncbi:MAG: response regulator [Oligoflexia bacterium]|nr:response regulator [Oligoflexia bacterium]
MKDKATSKSNEKGSEQENESTENLKIVYSLDDDEDFNTILVHSLKKIGIYCIAKTDPKDFFLDFVKGPPALCILDLNIGKYKSGGLTILRLIRERFGFAFPVIMFSQTRETDSINLALEMGANDYLTKPLDEFSLHSKIDHFLKLGVQDKQKFARVPEKFSNSSIFFNLTLKSINEYGIYISTKFFCAKKTPLWISGEILKEITQSTTPILMSVSNVSALADGTYGLFLEFGQENQGISSKARTWIINKNKKMEKESGKRGAVIGVDADTTSSKTTPASTTSDNETSEDIVLEDIGNEER